MVRFFPDNDHNSIDETLFLLRSPENATRLLAALRGDVENDRSFATVDDLRAELGLPRRGTRKRQK